MTDKEPTTVIELVTNWQYIAIALFVGAVLGAALLIYASNKQYPLNVQPVNDTNN